MINLVIFDLDGVSVEAKEIHFNTLNNDDISKCLGICSDKIKEYKL